MIEGLNVTVPGTVVQELLNERAKYHLKRREDYRKTHETLAAALAGVPKEEAPKLSSVNRDPVEEAKAGIERHDARAKENQFLAKYVDVSETFLLDTEDLRRLGVIESRY